jgi:hypothetical protein
MQDITNKQISKQLIEEISRAITTVGAYGSVEIYIQNNVVTQITMRNIKKIPKGDIDNSIRINHI